MDETLESQHYTLNSMTRDEIDELPENKKPYTASAVRPAPTLLEPAPVLLEPTPVLPESPPSVEPLEQTWRSENSQPKTMPSLDLLSCYTPQRRCQRQTCMIWVFVQYRHCARSAKARLPTADLHCTLPDLQFIPQSCSSSSSTLYNSD
jgi:hypothetical protein